MTPTLTSRSFRAAFASVCCLALATFSVAAEPKKSFDIPSGSAVETLKQYQAQSGTQLLYPGDAIEGIRTHPAKGTLTPSEALDQMFAGTGLKVVKDQRDGSLTLRRETEAERKNAFGAAPGSARPSEKNRTDGDYTTNEKGEGVIKMPDFMVTGAKTLNADIPRTQNDPMPYVVFSRDDIEKSNATNLEDFFRTRLTMNAQETAANQAVNSTNAGNYSQINLRGLGVTQTLILVDGRPAPRLITAADEFTQADLNGIPMSAIERIEILPSSAGGIYGGGAVGGVINVIRKRDYRGVDIRLGYDAPFRGGGETSRIEITGGFGLNQSRTQVSFSASYSSSNPLYVADADEALWRPGRQLYAANNTSTSSFLSGATPNIAATGGNLVLRNGTPLNSNHTYIPNGYAGTASDSGAALVANAGRYNIELSDDIYGKQTTLRNNPVVKSGNVNLRHQFNPKVETFLDFTYTDNLGRSQLVNAVTTVNFTTADPGNPFLQPVNVKYPITGVPTLPQRYDAESLRGAGGFVLRLGHDWVANAEYNWNRTETTRIYGLDPQLNATSFAAAAKAGTINLFRDLRVYPIDFTPYLSPGLTNNGSPTIKTTDQSYSGRVSGPLVAIAGGTLDLTAAVEHRMVQMDPFRLFASATVARDFAELSQQMDSAYTELTAPITSPRNARPWLKALEFQAAARQQWSRTRSASLVTTTPTAPPTAFAYSTNRVQSTDYTLATKWTSARDVSFRASYATGLLPPSVSQIVPLVLNPNILNLPDPRRGNEIASTNGPVTQIAGGNTGLQPETSKSVSIGVIFTPQYIPGLRVAADYTQIKKNNEINSPDAAFILAYESDFPGRVVRGPNIAGDPSGYAGPIQIIDRSRINIAKAMVEAWDFNADYTRKTVRSGEWHFYGAATLQTQLRRQALPNAPEYDLVGFYDGASAGPLEWRGNVGVDWSLGRWDLGWNSQYYHGYSLLSANPQTVGNGTTRVINQGGVDRIPSQIYHDFNVRYRFPESSRRMLHGLVFSMGVQNVFDTKPPVVVGLSLPVVTYSSYGDARLRRYTLSVTKHFGN